MQKYALIVAGGSGVRMKSNLPKQFISIAGKPILMHTIEAYFLAVPGIEIILVLPENQKHQWEELCATYQFSIPHQVMAGGKTRFHSVKNGLSVIGKEGLVAIHDGVRPLVSPETIHQSFEVAHQKGNAVAAVPLKDSIRRVEGKINQVEDRDHFQLIQTPQTFQTQLIKKAFEMEFDPSFTDDATVLERLGETIHLISGDYKNIKITTAEDLLIAEALLSKL